MYRFIVILILTAITMPAFSASKTITTQTPIYNPHFGAYYGGDYIPARTRFLHHKQSNSIFPDINDLERYAMNKNYSGEHDKTRLERLENLAFGAIQEGDYPTRYNNVRNAILTRPKQNYKTSLLRNLSDYFGGQMTGFTPPITQMNNSIYNSPYSKSSISNYSTPWGHRTDINNYGFGSGTGIKILD